MSIFNTLLRPISKVEIEEKKAEASAVEETTEAENSVDVNEAEVVPVPVPFNEKEEKETRDMTIASYFESRGIEIDLSHSNSDFAPVEELAMLLAMNYDNCREFYKYLRDLISKKKFDIHYNTYRLTPEQRNATNMVASRLSKVGIISNLRIPDNSKEIVGKLSSAPRVINFLQGDFLEFYSRIVVKQIVENIAKKRNCDYEIYSNVHIKRDYERHELDIVFRIGREDFWSEIKSGNFSEFDFYRLLGIFMGVNPDRHILLAAEIENKDISTIAWLYQYYVSNIHTFKEKLIEMIENAFTEGNEND